MFPRDARAPAPAVLVWLYAKRRRSVEDRAPRRMPRLVTAVPAERAGACIGGRTDRASRRPALGKLDGTGAMPAVSCGIRLAFGSKGAVDVPRTPQCRPHRNG